MPLRLLRVAAMAVFCACYSAPPHAPTAQSKRVPAVDDGMVDVDGRRLHVHCGGAL
jgi:hypothetical protein